MGNWRLTAKENLSSPHGGKNLYKGFTVVVAGQSTGSLSLDEVRGALINVGFSLDEAERYISGSPNNNFNCERCGDTDWNLVKAQREALDSAKEEKRKSAMTVAETANGQSNQTNDGSKRGGLFGNLLSVAVGIASAVSQSESGKSNEKKSGGLFGETKKAEPEKKFGGLFGGTRKVEPEKKSGGLFGGAKKTEPEKKSGGLFGGAKKTEPEKKSGGLFGGAKKTEPEKKSGGLFGGTKKAEPEKKSRGIWGGDDKPKKTKSSSSMIGSGSKSRGLGSGIGGKKIR